MTNARKIVSCIMTNALLILFISSAAHAAPSVLSISGTVTHGGSVTVRGTGFGTKSTVPPVKWDNFEWGNAGAAITSNGWISIMTDEGDPVPSLSTTHCYGGTRAAYNSMQSGGTIQSAYLSFSGSLEMYATYMIYWDYDTSNAGVQKFSRFNSGTPYSGAPDLKIQAQPSDGWIYATQQDGAGSGADTTVSGNITSGSWHRIEMYLKLSNPGGSTNGATYVSFDNGPLQNTYTPSNITRGSGVTGLLDSFILPFMWANNTGYARIWVDDVYLDNTLARVEICAGSPWANRGHCEIQIPQGTNTWTDNGQTNGASLQIQVNQGSFADSSIAYLYVIDASGTPSAGYSIAFGSGSTIAAPAAPSGLTVQ